MEIGLERGGFVSSGNDLPRVGRLNRVLEEAWRRGVSAVPTLDPDALVAKAERRERAELRGGSWEEPFRLLAGEVAIAAQLNPLGRSIAHGQLVKLLRQRIRAERLWRARPELLDANGPPPVVILGQMRSGTTRLHRLLACDPQFGHTRLHETLTPLARSRAQGVAGAVIGTALLRYCNPALRTIHPTSAREPEEEFGLHGFSFFGAMFEAEWQIPRFARYWEGRDTDRVYREFAALVRALALRRGEGGLTPLLKAPQFMADVPSLLAAFPGATLLRLERDPAAVVGSTASLVWHQQRVQSDAIDPHRVGAEWLRKTELRQRRADAALAVSDAPILSVNYDAMSHDWRGEMRRIYAFLGRHLYPEIERRMTQLMGGKEHHGHRYQLQQFGLDEVEVRRRLARSEEGVGIDVDADAGFRVPLEAT